MEGADEDTRIRQSRNHPPLAFVCRFLSLVATRWHSDGSPVKRRRYNGTVVLQFAASYPGSLDGGNTGSDCAMGWLAARSIRKSGFLSRNAQRSASGMPRTR